MGILLGLGSTAFFGLQQILVRIGMRARPRDDGLFMSVLLNVILLGVVLAPLSLPDWDPFGVLGFIVAGLLTTWAGRRASFKAIRRIGPARTSAFLISGPAFAALAGWLVLDEEIHLTHAIGASTIILGLIALTRSRVVAESLVPDDDQVPPGGRNRTAGRSFLRSIRRSGAARAGLAYALLSAFFFGIGFVVRKWALLRYPNAVAGAFFGAVAALSAILITAGRRRGLPALVDGNFRTIPWSFVFAGVSSSVGLVMQFGAFFFAPAWIVSLLQGTQGLWMLLWSPVLLGREERITLQIAASILLVAVGAGIIALRS